MANLLDQFILPPPPNKNLSPNAFSLEADAWVAAMPDHRNAHLDNRDEVLTLRDDAQVAETGAAQSASDAQSHADDAQQFSLDAGSHATDAQNAAVLAAGAANAPVWTPGSYTAGVDVVKSPADNMQPYVALTTHNSTIDPSADPVNWHPYGSGVNISVSDDPYDEQAWDGDQAVPTKNAIRDYWESLTIPVVSNAPYDATAWDGDQDAPTKAAVRDKVEAMVSPAVFGPSWQTSDAAPTQAAVHGMISDDPFGPSWQNSQIAPTQAQVYAQMQSGGGASQCFIVHHEQVGNGGDGLANNWHKTPLNTLLSNEISGASFNSATGEFTLPAGDYECWMSQLTAWNYGCVQRLYNQTQGSELLTGSPSFIAQSVFPVPMIAFGKFGISAASQIKHEIKVADQSAFNRGRAPSFSGNSTYVYTQIMIRKV